MVSDGKLALATYEVYRAGRHASSNVVTEADSVGDGHAEDRAIRGHSRGNATAEICGLGARLWVCECSFSQRRGWAETTLHSSRLLAG